MQQFVCDIKGCKTIIGIELKNALEVRYQGKSGEVQINADLCDKHDKEVADWLAAKFDATLDIMFKEQND